MSAESRIELARLLALLEDDQEVLDRLIECGALERRDVYDAAQAEMARVARTLVRELDVNWEGVEIILRMRTELLETRRQVAELLALIAQRMQGPPAR